MTSTAHVGQPAAVTVDRDPRNPRGPRWPRSSTPGSFTAITAEDDSGMLAGVGRIDGTPAVAFCSDPTIQGGAMGEAGCKVILAAYERALADGVPGHRPLALRRRAAARGRRVAARRRPGLRDHDPRLRARSRRSPSCSARPPAAPRTARRSPTSSSSAPTAASSSPVPTSSARSPARTSTCCASAAPSRTAAAPASSTSSPTPSGSALDEARRVADLLGTQGTLGPVEDVDLGGLLPESRKRAYDVHPLVDGLLDEGTGVELHPRWAPNIITTLGRLGGRTVGVIANNPLRLGGCLDSSSAEKSARFVRMCDAFGVPLVVARRRPRLPARRRPGVGRRRAPRREAAARVRRVRRAARHRRHPQVLRRRLHRDELTRARRDQGLRLADAQIAVMGAVAAVRILHRRKLADVPEDLRAQVEHELADEHEMIAGGLDRAIVDRCRRRGHRARRRPAAPSPARSSSAPAVRGRHGNIPL